MMTIAALTQLFHAIGWVLLTASILYASWQMFRGPARYERENKRIEADWETRLRDNINEQSRRIAVLHDRARTDPAVAARIREAMLAGGPEAVAALYEVN